MSSTKCTLKVSLELCNTPLQGETRCPCGYAERAVSAFLGPKFQDHSDKMKKRQVAHPALLFSVKDVLNISKQWQPAGEKKDPWDNESKSIHCTQPGVQQTNAMERSHSSKCTPLFPWHPSSLLCQLHGQRHKHPQSGGAEMQSLWKASPKRGPQA